MNVSQNRSQLSLRKPCQGLTSIGLALLLGTLTACAAAPTQVSAQTAPSAAPKQAKKHSTPNAQPAKAKPQQRKKSAPPQKQATRPVRLAAVTGIALASSAQTQAWAQDAAQRLQLDPTWVQNTLAQAQRLPSVERLILPPSSPTAKNWAAYRARFIEPIRIQAGARFWQTHRAALERAEREYGVPASVIVGIIGVETLYGQYTGNFRILDALATLTFHFPSAHPRAAARQAFFQSELEQFLLLTSRSGADPLAIRGSYAGAMGLPQFMPSSWAKFAVDFDGDGRIDLFGSPTDAIGSVANYFKAFDWRPGIPTHYPVSLTPGQTNMDTLLAPDILPTFSVASFVSQGAALSGAALQHTGPLALIELLNGPDAPSYVAGTENFYAITRYNWSSYYAMAVIDLAEAVAREMQSKP
jgi:membrane-bound lytic murein transglycosylase B